MDLGLRDRVCLVTGSTSGIGLETARLLVAEGARVVVSGRDQARAERARDDSGAALGVACDLSEPAGADRLVSMVAADVGPVECLVNNVGEAYQTGFEEVTDEQWDAMWRLNVMSYVRCIRAVLPKMKEAVLSLPRLVANLYANAGIRCNAVTPGPTATAAWLGQGGLADQQGERSGKSRAEVLQAVGAGRPLGRLA